MDSRFEKKLSLVREIGDQRDKLEAWDLAGKILQLPVSKLLGGNFRDKILLYSHATDGR